MHSAPMTERIVEVISASGPVARPQYRYGSGCLVAGRTVLTAAHVVSDARSINVRLVDKTIRAATADPEFLGDEDGPGPDLALLELDIADAAMVSPMPIAIVDRRGDREPEILDRCHSVGYPSFAERRSPALRDGALRETSLRDTAQVHGVILPLSKLVTGYLSLTVTSSPRPLPDKSRALAESEWAGMSGAPVVARGHLIGVVTEHAAREGSSALTVTPLSAIDADPGHARWRTGVLNPPEWWRRLGVPPDRRGCLRRLPDPPEESAYRATVREIQGRTSQLIGRQDELRAITEFATGTQGHLWLQGEAWSGKTALLAEAVAAVLPDEVDSVAYFLSRREADADVDKFLASVVPQLAVLVGSDIGTTDLHRFRFLWERAAERAMHTGRHLLLVVDGLDEDMRPGHRAIAGALPSRQITEYAHIVVSSRPRPDVVSDLPVGHALRTTVPVTLNAFAGATELQAHAQLEIDQLVGDDGDGLATDVLGLLAAAAGPLSLDDLAALTTASAGSPQLQQRLRFVLTVQAARTVQSAGMRAGRQFQFAHEALLAYAQTDEVLADDAYRTRVHRWAASWQRRRWSADRPLAAVPGYLFEAYPSTLVDDPDRLAALVSDPGWVCAAVAHVGIDRTLAVLSSARSVTNRPAVEALCALVEAQAHHLRATTEPGFVEQQLCLQALLVGEPELADALRDLLASRGHARPLPGWTTSRVSRKLVAEVGTHDGGVGAVGLLPDGRIVSCGGSGTSFGTGDGRVLLWDLERPGEPHELGIDPGGITAVAVTSNGMIITGGVYGRVLLWDPDRPGQARELGYGLGRLMALQILADDAVVTGHAPSTMPGEGRLMLFDPRARFEPRELGTHAANSLGAIALLPDGRIVTGGAGVGSDPRDGSDPHGDGRILLWDRSRPGRPEELGVQQGGTSAIAVLPTGHIASGGASYQFRYDYRYEAELLLVWDPARPGRSRRLGSQRGGIDTIAVLADGRVATSNYDDGRIMLWDPSFRATPHLLGVESYGVGAMTALPDGRLLTCSGFKEQHHHGAGRILLWNPDRAGLTASRHGSDTVTQVSTLPDGRIVGVEGDSLGIGTARVVLWDPEQPWGRRELGEEPDGVGGMAVLPDGRIVTCDPSHVARSRILLWDPDRGGGPLELGRHDDRVQDMTVLPGGRIVTRTCNNIDGSGEAMLLWDPAQPGRARDLGKHDRYTPVVLPDGTVATAGWTVRRGHEVRIWNPDHAEPGANVRTGRWLRTRSTSRRSPPSPERVIPVEGDVVVAGMAGGRIITGGVSDGSILVWESDPVCQPRQVGVHEGRLTAILPLAGGRIVTLGKTDAGSPRLALWDTARPGHVRDFALGAIAVERAAVLPNGQIVALSGGSVQLCDPDTGSVRRVACDARALASGRTRTGDVCVVLALAGGGILYLTLTTGRR